MAHTKADLLKLIDAVTVWKRSGERAPHKPLLILLGITLFLRGRRSYVPFTEIEEPLQQLLTEYGPPRAHVHPEYPFWRLQKDDLWEVDADSQMQPRRGHDDPRISQLRRCNARGFFPAWIAELLANHPDLCHEIVSRILAAHFPSELHYRIRRDLQLPTSLGLQASDENASEFRSAVLNAYSGTCAMSGFSVEHAGKSYGVDAAYIKWPQAGGPSRVSNGIAMTCLHVDLFARGIIAVAPDYTVCLMKSALLTAAARKFIEPNMGHRITLPRAKEDWPDPKFLRWHYTEVYRDAPVTI